LLQRELGALSPAARIEVLAVPCVMGVEAMREEMIAFSSRTLAEKPGSITCIPEILNSTLPRLRFGEPNSELLETWMALQKFTSIEFDLLYAPSAWRQIFHDWKLNPKFWEGSNIIYLHSGGTESNDSQLRRYAFKGASKP
jgi:1-aminocyclopropane-1-carboxylate deaminase/D-cysteine desulfhydrase-like pyridoxal-dependent ACC family enzyme